MDEEARETSETNEARDIPTTPTLQIHQIDPNDVKTNISPNPSPHTSPIRFRRGEVANSRRYLNPTATGQLITPNMTPSSTVPNSPEIRSETPETVPVSPTVDASPVEACAAPPTTYRHIGDPTNGQASYPTNGQAVIVLEPFNHVQVDTPQQTPDNTRVRNTPATSKQSTGTSSLTVALKTMFTSNVPQTSLIVPILMPDRHGTFQEQEPNQFRQKIKMQFAISVPKPKRMEYGNDAKEVLNPILYRRRSLFRQDGSTKMLTVEQHEGQNKRTRSAHETTQVRMLLSLSDLRTCRSCLLDGKVFDRILQVATENLNRKAYAFTNDTSFFRQQVFIPCQSLTELPSHCVGAPLIDEDHTYITAASCTNILGRMFALDWPASQTPIVRWYEDDRVHEDV